MGINDAEQSRKEKRKAAASEARKSRYAGQKRSSDADWSSVDGTLIAKAIAATARMGGALRMGYTRDGGAYNIGVYGDGDPFTIFVSPNEDVEEVLRGIIEDYEN